MSEEQLEIIECAKNMQNGEILKINACAGSGKTTTLVAIAESMPNERFLYLAFNKNVVLEARQKFPPNVDVKTLHALAYASVIAPHDYEVGHELKVHDLQEIFNDNFRNKRKRWSKWADLLKDIKTYLNSKEIVPNDDIKPYVKELFRLMKEREIPYTHSFYLKEYQWKKNKNLHIYDYILLDEAQDTNDNTLNIFLDNPCKKILVGDSNQNIYGFLDTINALLIVESNYEKYLTNSFRTPQSILDKANFFLKKYANLKYNMKSMANFIDIKTMVILTRTNARIIEYVIKEMENDTKNINLLKNPDEIFECSIALLNFQNNEELSKKYAFLNSFQDLYKIKEYAEATYDNELKFAYELVNKYNDRIYDALEYAKSFLFNNLDSKSDILSAHSAKGLEWDSVVIASDFDDINTLKTRLSKAIAVKQKDKEKIKKYKQYLVQETNLYYVALTRTRVSCQDLTSNNKFYEKCLESEKQSKTNPKNYT
ncbi:AAA family ATPase [Helicobacter saguini]|uniref:AAA family ATPase n=1 Tax=Helicobacter saguini TaxID=1548018 RepID=A0A347VRK8_9HELI|nr:AAA family ATPase [Helicobacter saguini]MWV62865.1 AAA family ATPase [Helicobacter saguini]MWV66464.1 AAA family ATPase [Helicobacter saguini]MWV68814.1 AAA family ATPase [Helicobacter saguini]MWV71631.1 AAA family ATPase [Helicobacter saguini]TLD94435.1 hypothetical protein LS64_005770 [Helicobacter saguini]